MYTDDIDHLLTNLSHIQIYIHTLLDNKYLKEQYPLLDSINQLTQDSMVVAEVLRQQFRKNESTIDQVVTKLNNINDELDFEEYEEISKSKQALLLKQKFKEFLDRSRGS